MFGKLETTTLPKMPKLLQTLHPKEGYVLHYLTLKLYHELGMKITHLGKVLQFRQSHWMAPFVDLNTRLRKAAVNKFQENFYKLIVNSTFGKTIESKLGRKKLEIVRNERELLQKTALSTMKSFQIIDDQLATISFSVKKNIVGQTYDSWRDHPRPRQAFHVSVSLSKNGTKSKLGTTLLRHG